MKNNYQAHETFWTDFKMRLSLFTTGLIICLVLQIIILIFNVFSINQSLVNQNFIGTKIPLKINYLAKYYLIRLNYLDKVTVEPELLIFFKYQNVSNKNYQKVLNYYSNNYFYKLSNKLEKIFWSSFWIYSLFIIYVIFFFRKSYQMSEEEFVRGVQKKELLELNEKLAANINPEIINIKLGNPVILKERYESLSEDEK